MPGISFVYDADGRLAERESELRKCLSSLLHYPDYELRTPLTGNDIFLGYTRHGKYPVTIFENAETFICVEGRMYGKQPAAIEKELGALSKSIFAREGDYKGTLVRWMLGTDGDFNVFMLHKGSREFCVFNDALSRLPLYYSIAGGTLVVSREPRFIAGVRGRAEFDREAVAQYLLLGYPLGDKTVFKGILQLPYASIIMAGGANRGITVEQIHRYDFEDHSHGRGPIGEQTHALAQSYRTAIKNRHDSLDRNVLGLSGGMDSRMASSCLASMGLPFSSATFQYDYYASSRDIEIAKQVAAVLKSDWRLFQTGPATGADVLELLRIKNGLNFLGMSFSMPLFRAMKEVYGDGITLITGDGGDKVVRDIRPVKRMGNVDALVDYVLAANQLVPLDVVSAITSIDKAEIIGGLRARFESYAERDMRLKYVHFIICERCMKWHYQGEDRNRFSFWPVTPFYSIDFFTKAMNCPFDFKTNYRIFGEMLISFSPETAAIKNSKWDMPITSSRMRFYWAARKAYLYLPLPVRHFIRAHYFYRRRIGVYTPNSNAMSCFFDQLNGCGAIADYLSIDAVKGNLDRIDKMAFDHLFTLTSTIEDFTGSRSSLEAYADRDMI